ncbi:MAG TPA: acetyl-CoA hydrolase/transferase C-terminal domain-containing protein, partial [Chthoniobacterales bacterium]
DLRGKSPTERAHLIINNCAHPAYRDELNEFLTFVARGHTPTTLSRAFAMHEKFIETGTMHGVEWGAASLV